MPQRLWNLTHGNVLYLRNIVEQEISDGRLVRQRGFVRWLGDPVLPRGLVALIESRMGGLPDPVSDVVDTLAVGEPIDLAALQRSPTRPRSRRPTPAGLIVLDSWPGVQVRLAHPLFGQIRRKRAPATKLRRLRGLVAAELAGSDDIPDRGTAGDPHARGRRRAGRGSPAAGRTRSGVAGGPAAGQPVGRAATRAGAGPEPNFVRAHALSWLGRGEEAESVLAGIPTDGLTDGECARLAFLRASNLLWAIGDPARAKAVIDDAARVAPPAHARTSTPSTRCTGSRRTGRISPPKLLNPLSARSSTGCGCRDRVGTHGHRGGRRQDERSRRVCEGGGTTPPPGPWTRRMRFNIADAHVGALPGGRLDPRRTQVADWVRGQAADLPGAAANRWPELPAGPRSAPVASTTRACCWNVRRPD